ncbi:MAG: hypothetical protein HFH36_12250 [Lachnospiraceae bacterium]|nr:hypothetical protein [Lachnospiraceae bacterium]
MKKYLKYLLVIVAAVMCMGGIKAEAKSFQISAPSKTMYVKQKQQMVVTPSAMKGKVRWRTSDKKTVSVTGNGLVTAKNPGSVKVYAVSLENRGKKAAFPIKVVAFKKKTFTDNCFAVESVSGLLPGIGKKYRVFDSKKEIAEYLKAGKEEGGYIAYGIQGDLKKYKKSFFKKKSLCLVYISTFGSGSTPVAAHEMQLVQDKKGKVTAKIRVGVGEQGPDEAWTGDVVTYYALAELSKKDAAMIDGYKTEMFKMVELPPIID